MTIDTRRGSIVKEEIRRREAREHLLPFIKYTMPTFEDGLHHSLICHELERVFHGDEKRLMLFAPPRHTKSEIASRRFPAWWLGHRPNNFIINTSYAQTMANSFGRSVRSILKEESYQRIFDTRLDPERMAVNEWGTTQDGEYRAAGIGGGITGTGAHLALIDDPVKDRLEADSVTFQKRNFEWYTSTLYTRLMPGGAIVVIMTRWNLRDLAGLLEAEGESGSGLPWRIVRLPAIAGPDDPLGREEGAALWPEWFPLETLEEIKSVLPLRDWSALYQQVPAEESGTFFKKDWFRYYTTEELLRAA